MLPSGFLAHILPPSIDSCWLGFRSHSSPRTIQSLPFPPLGLHPSTPKRSPVARSEEHTSELQSHLNLVCRLLLEKKNLQTPTQAQYLVQALDRQHDQL